MNAIELLQYALGNSFGILGQVTADLTQEQADWQPPGIANPIGAMYWHTISGADDVAYRWALGQEPLRDREGWDERVLAVPVPEPEHGGDWQAYMRAIRVDLPALHDYARTVAEALQVPAAAGAIKGVGGGAEAEIGGVAPVLPVVLRPVLGGAGEVGDLVANVA